MKRAQLIAFTTLIIVLLLSPVLAQAQHWAGIIAPPRATDWTTPGVQGGIPNRTTICTTLNPGASTSQINNAIQNCPAGQVVQLGAGTFSVGQITTQKSNVTLRGMGANQTFLNISGDGCNGLPSSICVRSEWIDQDNPPNSATWTAGYTPGTTVITVGSSSGMKVGGIIILDQLNDSSDSGGVFVCSVTSCTDEGGNSPGRNNRGQQQIVKVVSIAGSQVTITPPIRMPNWRSGQQPGVFWNSAAPVVSGFGIENLSVTASNGQNGIVFMGVSDCWAKGVRTVNPDRSHYWLFQSLRITVRDSYLYGGQGGASQSYGVEDFSTGNNLIENNIFQHVTAPLSHNGANHGSVFAYNFAIDDNFSQSPGWMIPNILYHEVGISHLLHEGNDGLGALHDDIHGTTHFNTLFRNHFYGDVWNNPAKDSNTQVIHIQSYGRFFNLIGNVMGRAGYYNTYDDCSNRAIYCLGDSPEQGVPDDPRTTNSMLRWGNYDTVSNANRFVTSEVPSGDSFFPNPVPSNQAIPASFYLSGPPSFWSTPWGTPPWPAIGPDVTGGNISGWGGHANKIPARLCYENTPKNGQILNFNAASCYSSSSVPRPEPPTQLTILVQ